MITSAHSISLTETMAKQRSVRAYSADAVTAEQIQALLGAAVQAPTALHAEPWKFAVVQDASALRRYSDLTKPILLKQADAFRDLYDLAELPEAGTFNRMLVDPNYNLFYNASTLVAICAKLTNPFVTADCWLAAQNLMLAATALGLGTCVIGSALTALNSAAVKAELKTPDDHTVVVAIIVGVSAEAPRARARKPPVILSWNAGAAPSTGQPSDETSSPGPSTGDSHDG